MRPKTLSWLCPALLAISPLCEAIHDDRQHVLTDLGTGNSDEIRYGALPKLKEGSGDESPFDSKFDALVNRTLDLWKVPGFAIGVVRGEKKWAKGYGFATVPDTPVTPSTMFYAGSTTKAFTASVMAMLVEDDEDYPHVKWDTPVSSLIRDDFVLQDEYATNHITIEDILSHRTGMPRHDASYAKHYNGSPATPRDVVRSLRHLPLTAELRTTYQYCNTMFVTASHVIQRLTKTWLGDVIAEKIWKPLDMNSTYFSTAAALNSSNDLAMGYYYDNATDSYKEVPYTDLSSVSGAGSVITNVEDYCKWLYSLMTLSGPLSNTSHRAVRQPRSFVPDSEENGALKGMVAYSLGWTVGNYRGYEVIWHTGGMEAYGTHLMFLPELQFGLVAFGNTAYTSYAAQETLLYHLVDNIIGVPEEDRFDFNSPNLQSLSRRRTKWHNAAQEVYPHLPARKTPPSLPLPSYSGTYFHPAYLNITIQLPLTDNASSPSSHNPLNTQDHDSHTTPGITLYAYRKTQTWPAQYTFEHVSGEFWVCKMDSLTSPGLAFREIGKAEFRLGLDGVVMLGVALEPKMRGELIWFERVE